MVVWRLLAAIWARHCTTGHLDDSTMIALGVRRIRQGLDLVAGKHARRRLGQVLLDALFCFSSHPLHRKPYTQHTQAQDWNFCLFSVSVLSVSVGI